MDGGMQLAHYMSQLRTEIFLHYHPHKDCRSEAQCLSSAVKLILTANKFDIGSDWTFFTSWRSFIEDSAETYTPLYHSCSNAMFLRESQTRLAMWYDVLPSIFQLPVSDG